MFLSAAKELQMLEVLGTIHDGQVKFDQPVQLPEGTRVRIEALDNNLDIVGITEEEQLDPARHEAWLAKLHAIEPLEFTPEEELSIAAFRARVRELSIEAVRRRMETVSPT
jgi:hypothetical protein